MQKRCNGVFNIPVKSPRADIDFVPVLFAVYCPDGMHTVVTICTGCALNRDNRGFKFPAEKVFIEKPENLFKLSRESACLCNLFHWCISDLYILELDYCGYDFIAVIVEMYIGALYAPLTTAFCTLIIIIDFKPLFIVLIIVKPKIISSHFDISFVFCLIV